MLSGMLSIRSLRLYAQAKDAVTAVEFALVAPVFLLMISGIVEYSLYYFKTSHLKHVLYEASRNIQTGEVQDAADPQAFFQSEYCQDVSFLAECSSISFDVRAFDSLAEISYPDASFGADGAPTNFVFQPGGSDQLTVMRVATPYTFITPLMADIFQPSGQPAIIVGYSVARNEPF
jgi:Flp pilus assembly protein TadG